MNIIFLIILFFVLFAIIAASQNKKRSSGRREDACQYFETQRIESQRIHVPESISSTVKGISYRSSDEIGAARFCDIGDTLILVPEPDNEYDPNAVKIYTMEGFHIGYVDAEYSEMVSSHINNIDRCKITRVTKDEIPFIDYNIRFTSNTVSQPQFIPKEFQCSPEDKMRNMSLLINDSCKYRRVLLMVEGLYELDRATIAKARAALKGDKIILKKGDCNEYFPYRLEVYLEDGTYVGHADNLCSAEVYNLYDSIVATFIDNPIGSETANRLAVSVLFPNELKCPEQFRPMAGISFVYSGSYPEVKTAQELRRVDPMGALDILLPIVKKEKGIAARIECIACYYHLKDWEARISIINETIQHIEALTEEDLPKKDLNWLHNYIPTLVKQLDYSQKRLETTTKKRK